MHKIKHILVSNRGSAVVEATILFPIIFMIFFGLVILAMYLPTRSALQYATQGAANALAVEQGDTWLNYDENSLSYKWAGSKSELPNVYVALVNSMGKGDYNSKARTIVTKLESKTPTFKSGTLEVKCYVNNYIIYKEIIVTATRKIPSPINLSFINFPTEIPITVSSTAVVQNGDEFTRNVDLAVEVVGELRKKYESIDNIFKAISKVSTKFNGFFGV